MDWTHGELLGPEIASRGLGHPQSPFWKDKVIILVFFHSCSWALGVELLLIGSLKKA